MLDPRKQAINFGVPGGTNSIHPNLDFFRRRTPDRSAVAGTTEREERVPPAMKIVRGLLLALCVVGAGLSVLSLRSHYATSVTDYCDLNETFNCDLVNRSTFSTVYGVPVALVGLVGYVLLFALSWRTSRWMANVRFAAAIAGTAFAVYLAYIEAHVLAVWCLLCIGSLACISGIALLSGVDVIRTMRLPTSVEGAGERLGKSQRNP